MALVDSIQLRPHQQQAIDKYLANNKQQILSHSLGSGKTITSLGAVESSDSKSALILTPAALTKNYQDSINKFVKADDRRKYTVMSYERFRMDPIKYVNKYKPDTMVIDEYHRQKDPQGVSYRALAEARPFIKNFLGLTGTLVQNTPAEIFPLVNLSTGNFNNKNMSKKDFNKNFTKIVKVYPKKIFPKIYAKLKGQYGETRVLQNTDKIKKYLKPQIDKNMPTEEFMSHFPTKKIEDIDVPMTDKQEKIYDYFMKKDMGVFDRWRVKNDLPPRAKHSTAFFSKLMHAREAANTPAVLSKNLTNSDPIDSSGKLSKAYKNLRKHLKDDKVNKVMVYSNFTGSGLDPFVKKLQKDGIPYGVFSGKVTKKRKNQDVTDFNEGNKKVLLVSPSGAEGLDLKGVTMQQMIDPHWNPEKMNQIIGRSARFNSHIKLPPEKRNVIIQRYKSVKKPGFIGRLLRKKPEHTIDHYIYNRAKEKQDLNDQFNQLY